jgi:PPOX class probable F420-dependent enzyme
MAQLKQEKGDESMTSILSDWAREFLREDRVAVVCTLNKDGSPQVTTIWYLLQEDGTLIMSTPGRTQKVKNLRRNPRITVCVGDERRSVSLYGTVTVSSDQNVIRQDLEQLAARYIKEEAARAPALALFLQDPRVAQRDGRTFFVEKGKERNHRDGRDPQK